MDRLTELQQLAKARALAQQLPYAGALTPVEAHEYLQLCAGARLIDVRTQAEWNWVGRVPDAVEIEWQPWLGAPPNPAFLASLTDAVAPAAPLLFICRSGNRSHHAARAASEAGFGPCYNVLEGFEGDKDGNRQRNRIGGWRVAGLPWYQG